MLVIYSVLKTSLWCWRPSVEHTYILTYLLTCCCWSCQLTERNSEHNGVVAELYDYERRWLSE